jgi:acetyl esterase/lipase
MVHLDGADKVVDSRAMPKAVSHQKSGSIFFDTNQEKRGPDDMPVDVGTTATAPPLNSPENQKISLITKSGDTLTIDQQVHMYTQNSLIVHPLISPALSYLGGLAPLLVIAGDKEVLRDEIIYT